MAPPQKNRFDFRLDSKRHDLTHIEEQTLMVLRASSDAVVMRSKAPTAYLPTASSFAAWMNCVTWGDIHAPGGKTNRIENAASAAYPGTSGITMA